MSSERFLIDTTIWVLYLKGDKDIEDRIRSLILQDKVATSEIVILEILRGARSQKEYNHLHDDFKALPLLRVDDLVWEESYRMGFKLKSAGINAPLDDILIASLSDRYGCPLLHRDKHFPLMANTIGLRETQL